MNDSESDFEGKVKTLLNERVDAKIGTREAPRFAPAGKLRRLDSMRRRSPWVLPLLAAACVAAVVGGSVGAAHLLADKHDNPTPATRVPAPKHTPSPSPSQRSEIVTLNGARLRLPSGWVARDYARYLPPPGEGQTYPAYQGWCLTPASTAVRVGGCPIWFRAFTPSVAQGVLMDVDNRGGSYGDPHQVCIPSGVAHQDRQAAERTFGGRGADWRYWRYDCASGAPFIAEQYVVATRPAFIVFSERVDAQVHQVLTDLAAHSSLPPATSGIRYEDFGYVRSIKVVDSGVKISIDRTVRDQTIDPDHTTYDYLVPSRVYAKAAKSVKVGKLAQLFTDGARVTLLYGYGS